MEFLSKLDFEIKHVKGKENKVADALSKQFHIATMSMCKADLRERVIKASTEDENYAQLLARLQEPESGNKYEGY